MVETRVASFKGNVIRGCNSFFFFIFLAQFVANELIYVVQLLAIFFGVQCLGYSKQNAEEIFFERADCCLR